MLWVCEGCGTRYAESLETCPHCGAQERHADYEEDAMPKVTVAGGPSNAAAEAEAAEVEAVAAEEAAAAEEEVAAAAPPPASAPKAQHVEYATAVLGVPEEEAAAKTKAELIEDAQASQDG